MEKIVLRYILLLALLPLVSCLREDTEGGGFVTLAPEERADGWAVSSPQAQGLDSLSLLAVLQDFSNNKAWWQARSLMVARNGFLVAEAYRQSLSDRARPCAVWSCTKQVLALTTFMAIEQGYVEGLSASVAQYLPTYAQAHPDKKDITLRQLLTMTSGIGFDNDGLNGNTNLLLRQKPQNSVDYILSLSLRHSPGTVFHYNDGDPHLVSALLGAALGMTTGDWCRKNLFEPLHIENYTWLTYPDGVTMGAFGLTLTPRDLTKFGQVVLERGLWNGKRLLSESSIDSMVQVHIPPQSTGYHGQAFGFY
ncbi:MAG: beta-lactamase family protein, partial [Bacteroidales bacterium]|nr:beta-lactamase family protein [Bacteroidales bacterium]